MATDTTHAPGTAPVLTVRDLAVDFFVDGQWFPAATGMTYDVRPGEVLAIVGESGSGKTQSSMSLLGLLPPNGRATGSAKLGDRELIGMPAGRLRRIRGKEVAIIFQEPMTALNPVYTVGFQIVETLRTHFDIGPADARTRAIELLRMVEIPEPGRRFDSCPLQLSGGQRQRVWVAMVLAQQTPIVLLDEPTTFLDIAHQIELLELCVRLNREQGTTMVAVLHDLNQAARYADHLVAMRDGKVVAAGAPREIVTADLVRDVFGLDCVVVPCPVSGAPLVVPA